MRNKLLVSNTHHSKQQNKTKTNKQTKKVLCRATLTLNQGKPSPFSKSPEFNSSFEIETHFTLFEWQ